MNCKNTTLALLIGLSQAGAVHSAGQEGLARSYACMSCHSMDKKVVGPGFKEVAARYKGDASVEDRLVDKIRTGGKGNWGNIPMPPNSRPSDEDLHTLVRWVLNLDVTGISVAAAPAPTPGSASNILSGVIQGVIQGMAQRNAQRGLSVPVPSTISSPSPNAPPSSPPIQTYPSNKNSSSMQNTAQPHGEPVNCLQVVENSYGAPQFHNRCNFPVSVSFCTTEGSCRCRTNPISSVCADEVGAGRDIPILGSGHVYSAQCNRNTKYSLAILENGKQSCR